MKKTEQGKYFISNKLKFARSNVNKILDDGNITDETRENLEDILILLNDELEKEMKKHE